METRNVTLTLEKAKEFYNSGNTALREVALQAFTKEELTIPKWQNIKTFEDACRTLGIKLPYLKVEPSVGNSIADHLYAICKLDIIRKALNGNWKPSLVQGNIYYPCVRLYSTGQKARETVSSNSCKLGKSFIADGKRYTLVSEGYSFRYAGGIANFDYGFGWVRPFLGLLGCKSKEIAEHMSRYFAKEIFEVIYAQHIGMYEWSD